jgi:hypothetical protein
MRLPLRGILSFLLLVALGCRHDHLPDDPVAPTGLAETALGRSLIEKAVEITNSWIDPEAGIRFAPSWRTLGPEESNDVVRVYSIDVLHAPVTYMVAVPTRCRCVFVQPRAYEKWLQTHLSHNGQTLEVSEERLLAFMLLHEAGHIVHGDPGEFDGSGSGALNTNITIEKEREQNADLFAVQQLKRAMLPAKGAKDMGPWLNAQLTSVDLSNLGFEMQQVRQEQFFGAESLNSPEAFYDVGYTHPNFELRLLTVNDMISNTDTSHQLLANFLAKRVPHSPILFQAPHASSTQ